MTNQPTLTGALAHAHVEDLLRDAAAFRVTAKIPRRRRTPRRRPLWWINVATRRADGRAVPATG